MFKTIDPRELPSYKPSEAARYLRMPVSTLRTWFFGYRDPQNKGEMQPVIEIADPQKRLLSFINLVEAHVLYSIRKDRAIPLPTVRKAIKYIQKTINSNHPLAEQEFATSGRDLFVKYLGNLIGANQEGQTAMSDVLKLYLRRIERDKAGMALKFFPYVRHNVPESEQPRVILIDPAISGGRPVLAGTGISTSVVAGRYLAGDSVDELAKDYGRKRSEIEDILRCEYPSAA